MHQLCNKFLPRLPRDFSRRFCLVQEELRWGGGRQKIARYDKTFPGYPLHVTRGCDFANTDYRLPEFIVTACLIMCRVK